MLSIQYKDGSLRLINPHALFYQPSTGSGYGKEVNHSIRQKIDMIAHDYGHAPFIISLTRGGKESERIRIDRNEPAQPAPAISREEREKERRDRLNVIKQFKKETKGQVFTFQKTFVF